MDDPLELEAPEPLDLPDELRAAGAGARALGGGGRGQRQERVARRPLALVARAAGRLGHGLVGVRRSYRDAKHAGAAHGSARHTRRRSGRGAAGAALDGIADGGEQDHTQQRHERQQTPGEQVGLERLQKLGHGFALTTAGAVPEAVLVEGALAAVVAEPAPEGPDGPAPPKAD